MISQAGYRLLWFCDRRIYSARVGSFAVAVISERWASGKVVDSFYSFLCQGFVGSFKFSALVRRLSKYLVCVDLFQNRLSNENINSMHWGNLFLTGVIFLFSSWHY